VWLCVCVCVWVGGGWEAVGWFGAKKPRKNLVTLEITTSLNTPLCCGPKGNPDMRSSLPTYQEGLATVRS
jgi:hypothetical protein